MVGKTMSIKFPKLIQVILNSLFIRLLRIDLSESNDIHYYKSLQEVFTRSSKRKLSNLKGNTIISPVESRVIQYGEIKDNTLLQVKGISYNVNKFLSSYINKNNLKKLEKGKFINLYLSPKDYHHFHAPIDMYVQKIIHIPGTLFPVKESFLKKNKIFSINERAVLEFFSKGNKVFYLVLIGALNVGNIKIFKEPRLQTNSPKNHTPIMYEYKDSIFIKKGEDIGCFNFGSSAVILSERNSVEYQDNLLKKQVKFGDIIGSFNDK